MKPPVGNRTFLFHTRLLNVSGWKPDFSVSYKVVECVRLETGLFYFTHFVTAADCQSAELYSTTVQGCVLFQYHYPALRTGLFIVQPPKEVFTQNPQNLVTCNLFYPPKRSVGGQPVTILPWHLLI